MSTRRHRRTPTAVLAAGLAACLLACLPARLSAQTSTASAPANDPYTPSANRLTAEQINEQWVAATAEFQPERNRLLLDVDRTIAAGPFRDDWQSLSAKDVPAWFADAKFGIFVHWGVFSVPAFGSEWYSRNMYQQNEKDYAHHRATFGDQTNFGYKDFIPQFRMQRFEPAEWAALFEQAGARYVVPVAEHHDGFALYDSHLSQWTAVKMGPRQDLVGRLEQAVRARGLHFGVSSHRAEHDWFFDGGRHFRSDVDDPRYASLYGPAELRMEQGGDDAATESDYTYVSREFRQDWLARSAELVDRYHPDLMYFDWWVGSPDFRETERRFATFYYDRAAAMQQPVVLFTKLHNMSRGSAVEDVERGAKPGIQPTAWQTDTSISNESWGFVEHDTFKSPQVLLDQLIDIVSKNGNLLLNIGPRADGTIPEAVQQTLRTMGAWLAMNGEAIYGSRPWTRFNEGPTQVVSGSFQDSKTQEYTPHDFRFTTRAGHLYAFQMRPEGATQVLIHSLARGKSSEVRQVTLLGATEPLRWQQTEDGLAITVPGGASARVFRIDLAGGADASH